MKNSLMQTIVAGVLALVVAVPGLVPDAHAFPACTAAELIAGNANDGCAATNDPCLIDQTVTTTGAECTFDFGSRAVTITKTGKLQMNEKKVTFIAGSFTVAAGGQIDGEGFFGGELNVMTSGDITVDKSGSSTGRVLMGGANFGGDVIFVAQGNVILNGDVKANNLGPNASGGTLTFSAAGDIVVGRQASIDPRGGPQETGGTIDFIAGGRIEINPLIDVGGDGSVITASAGTDFTLAGSAKLQADGGNDGGDGGEMAIRGGGDVQINGPIQCRGSSAGIGGGAGGDVRLESDGGDVIVRAEVSTRSGAPDGDGGVVTIVTDDVLGGSVRISASGGEVRADGSGTESGGGEVTMSARLDVVLDGKVLANAGDTGGDVVITAGRDITMTKLLDASGSAAGSLAGIVSFEAGNTFGGDVSLQNVIDVSGGQCDGGGLCSTGGDVEIVGCDVHVTAAGGIDASAPGATGAGGSVSLVARRQLRVDGPVDADATNFPGLTTVQHPSLLPPSIAPGKITPPAEQTACSDCTGECAFFCTELCDCGDGVVDQFEECDGSACGEMESCVCGVPGSVKECQFILSCGDGVVDPGEECDGTAFGMTTCESLGFPGGNLTCLADCRIDDSTCDPITCGDGNIDGDEVCEPDDLNGKTCLSLGYGGGVLTCGVDCTTFDDSLCSSGTCGDGTRCFNEACTSGPGGGPEECDDGNAQDTDSCRNDCSVAVCGDGAVCSAPGCDTGSGDDVEDCDDGNASNADACLEDCTFATCGDGFVCSAPGCTSGPAGKPEECDEKSLCCLSDCAIRSCNETGACDPTHICCPPGVSCDDGNPCTTDGCNPATGCTHVANQSPCDDGNACTSGDVCSGGVCASGAQISCDDGNPCTADSCNPVAGCVNVPDQNLCPVLTVPGKKISLKTKARKPSKNKLTLVLKGSFGQTPPADLPPLAGASLRLTDSAGQDVTFPLPAGGWKAKGSTFTYKDGKRRNGPCTKVVFKAGKSVKAVCKGEQIQLGPELFEPLKVILRSGATHFCASFGGTVSKNGNGTFVAKAAAAPAECVSALLTP